MRVCKGAGVWSGDVHCPQIDTQQLDRQIKAIMTEVIPFLKVGHTSILYSGLPFVSAPFILGVVKPPPGKLLVWMCRLLFQIYSTFGVRVTIFLCYVLCDLSNDSNYVLRTDIFTLGMKRLAMVKSPCFCLSQPIDVPTNNLTKLA